MKTCSPAHHFHRMPARWRVASRWLLLAFCVALLPQLALPTHAQTDATTASAALEGRIADPLMPTKKRSNMLAVGAANVLDTYLSAEKYNGTDVRYISTLTKPTRWSNIHQTFLNEGLFVMASNRADNNDELGGMYRFQYRLHRNWQVANGLELEAGAAAGIQVGFLYNTRNSNNPAQAYASLQLMPSAAATQQVTLLRRLRGQRAFGGRDVLAQLRTVLLRNLLARQLRPQRGAHDHRLDTFPAPHADS